MHPVPQIATSILYRPIRSTLRKRLRYVPARVYATVTQDRLNRPDAAAVLEVSGHIRKGTPYVIFDKQGEPGRWDNWSNEPEYMGVVDR